jgi:hypothetical protein
MRSNKLLDKTYGICRHPRIADAQPPMKSFADSGKRTQIELMPCATNAFYGTHELLESFPVSGCVSSQSARAAGVGSMSNFPHHAVSSVL